MTICRYVCSLSPSCILVSLLGFSTYVIFLGILTTKKLRLLEPNRYNDDRENVPICQVFHFGTDVFTNNAHETKIHPPKCHESSVLLKTNPTNSYQIFIVNGVLHIRNQSVNQAQTTRNNQCSLFPIVRLDEYHSIYGTPVTSIHDGYQTEWPAFMVLCQPSDNLNHQPHIRWNDKILKQQERHFICGSFPPVLMEEKRSNQQIAFNVLLLGLDSISRVAAERYLPQTMNWLRNRDQVELMDLYNIVGDGTTANLLALLTGLFETELPESRKSHVKRGKNRFESLGTTVLDHYPWLWDEFRRIGGYATHFIEDSPKWGTFQHRLTGFGTDRTPTHSYGRPCLLMSAQEAERFGKTLGCIGTR